MGCSNEQCIAACLLSGRYATRQKRMQRYQPGNAVSDESKDDPSAKKAVAERQVVSGHNDATVHSEAVASTIVTATMQSKGLNIHANEFIPSESEADELRGRAYT